MVCKKAVFLLLLVVSFYSCFSYHAKSLEFQKQLRARNFQKANHLLDKNRFLKKKRNKLLYYFEKGKTFHLQGLYKQSNEYFNKADYFIEDNTKKLKDVMVSVAINPEQKTYLGEDFEKVAIHYYKALNYIFLRQFQEAIVEVRRVNLQLQKINDKYPKNKKNHYATDAFALNLQGILYQLTGDVNNAFIAYRKAVDLYLSDKETSSYMGVSLPEQLKKDLLYTADYLGFENEKKRYEKLLHYPYQPEESEGGYLLLFWENGAVPYKSQRFYTFAMTESGAGLYNVHNDDLGLDMSVPISGDSNATDGDFSDLEVIRIAFPTYLLRPSFYGKASVLSEDKTYSLELIEDYQSIALATLRDRAFREIGSIILRMATKKITEYILREQNKDLGAALGWLNALTERADTRNWQSLPKQISYVKIPLKKGENNMTITFFADDSKQQKQINVIGDGSLKIRVVHTLKIKPFVESY